MDISEISTIADIATSISTAIIAFIVFFWTRKIERISQIYKSNLDTNLINNTVLSDNDLLKIEAENHPFGVVNEADMKRIYHYFNWLNVSVYIYNAHKIGIADKELRDTRLRNHALITFRDREFIRIHVFPRGYGDDFVRVFESHWNALEKKL